MDSTVWSSFHPFRTLRGRLTLLACLATFPAFIFVMLVAIQERGAALRHADQEARYVAGLASREHAHQLQGARRLLQRLAAEGQAKPPASLDRLLPAILSASPQFANLGILDPDGRLRFSVVPPERPVDMADNPAFLGALEREGGILGRYQVGQIVGRPVLILAQAMRGPGGRVRAVLFAALDLAWLDQLGHQAHLPPDYALLITDREGRVLARSEGEGPKVAEEGDLLPSFERLQRQGQGLTRGAGRDRKTRLFAAVPMEGIPDLYVAAGLPEEAVLGLANRAFLRALLALAVLTLLTVGSSIAAADLSVLREARQLAEATRRFGTGDLGARAPVPKAHGEIRDLALAFNGMAGALALRHQEALETQERLRALSQRVVAAREEESVRISRELHDQLGQELTALKLDLSRTRRQLQTACPTAAVGEVGAALNQMGIQLDGCVDSIRRISAELRPSVLDRLGLGSALEWLAREFERRTGLECPFDGPDLVDAPPSEVATALFRITQEALTNVARHSGARAAHVILVEEGPDLVLTIEDDGRGFDVGRNGTSLGLLGMKERARLVGGTLEVASTEGGTRVVAKVSREWRSGPC